MRIRVAAVAAVLLTLAAQSFAAYKVSVWIPPWSTAALTSIQTNAGALHRIESGLVLVERRLLDRERLER